MILTERVISGFKVYCIYQIVRYLKFYILPILRDFIIRTINSRLKPDSSSRQGQDWNSDLELWSEWV